MQEGLRIIYATQGGEAGGGTQWLTKIFRGQFFFDDYTTDLRPRDRWMIKHTWEYHNRVVNEHVNQIPHLTAVLMVTDKVCWI